MTLKEDATFVKLLDICFWNLKNSGALILQTENKWKCGEALVLETNGRKTFTREGTFWYTLSVQSSGTLPKWMIWSPCPLAMNFGPLVALGMWAASH